MRKTSNKVFLRDPGYNFFLSRPESEHQSRFAFNLRLQRLFRLLRELFGNYFAELSVAEAAANFESKQLDSEVF